MDITFVYKITGMQKDDCAERITNELERAGFFQAVVDQDAHELVLPRRYLPNIEDIKKVVTNAGHYNILY